MFMLFLSDHQAQSVTLPHAGANLMCAAFAVFWRAGAQRTTHQAALWPVACQPCAVFFAISTARKSVIIRLYWPCKSPKSPMASPKPLSEMKADAVMSGADLVQREGSEPWVLARDSAVLVLLYGCGSAHIRSAQSQSRARAKPRQRRFAHHRQRRQGAHCARAAGGH